MRKYAVIILLLTTIASHAQHSFFRGTNNYVAPIEATGSVSNGLGFDGIDDGVILNSSLLSANTDELTYELCLKPYQLGGFSALLNHDNWSNGYVHFQFHGNNIGFDVNGGNDNVFGYAFNINTWYHIAVVYSASAHNLKFYVNGVLQDTIINNNFPSIAGNVPINMGTWSNGRYFNGVMDEVRIWNVARTQSEIQSNMNTELAGTETGLVAYYPFNQGIAAGDNTAINTVTDKTANALNGTLTNFAKTGTTSNFVVGKVNTNNNGSTPSPPSPVLTGGLILNLDASNITSYPGTGSTWTDLSGSSNNISLFNGASYDPSNRNSILFDGVNDYVGKNTTLNTGQDFTVSVWMYATLLGNTRTSLVANSYNYSSGNGWFFCTDAGGASNSFFLSIGSDYPVKVSSDNIISINTWNYLTAVVKSGGRYIDLYKNGILISGATTDNGANTINYNYNNFSIGFRDPAGTPDPFHGNIGATQIYNRVLTANEVLQNFNTTKASYGL